MNLRKADEYYNGPEYLKDLRRRAAIWKDVLPDEAKRNRRIREIWSVNPIAFIEDFCLIKLPNYNNAIKPFFLFDYQKKIIRKLLESEASNQEHKIVIDKPREMGVTWVMAAYYYWRWLYTPNWSGFILSRTEAEVDDGSDLPDGSIMGKIRWLISRTPKILMPDGFTPKGKKGTSTDRSLKIMNPALGSSIVGSTTNASAGRSRRYSTVWVDEAFFVQNFNLVEQSLNTVARVQVYVSTSKVGSSLDKFVKEQEEKGDHISLTWRDHPWKDKEWYDRKMKEAERNPEAMREIEVSYALSDASKYYPQLKDSSLMPIDYDPARPVYMSMDTGRADLTVLIWCQYDSGRFNIIDCYSSKNKEIEWYAPFMNPDLPYNLENYPTEYQQKLLGRVRQWRKPIGYFCEADQFKKTMPTNTSIAQVLSKLGIMLRYNPYAREYTPRRIATSSVLQLTTFNSASPYVLELYDGIANSRYANSLVSAESAKKPVHDAEISDYRSALENLFVNLPRILRVQRSELRDEKTRSLTADLLKYLRV